MLSAITYQEDIVDRIIVLEQIVDKKMTQRTGAEKLRLTERHIRRLLKRFRQSGREGLLPLKRPGRKGFDEAFKETVLSLVKTHYPDFGPTFAAEKLLLNHQIKISREALRGLMMDSNLWQPKKQKERRIHQSRERRSRFGELVQLDGSHHDWFEGRAPKCCLYVLIDDATSQILALRFEETETTFGYMNCIRQHVLSYGIPLAYYSDKHSIFKTTRETCLDGRLKDTELHRALKEMKVELICAHSPEAKGRVERANQTLQDRLIKEMRLKGISSLSDGNAYLETFRKAYNERFGVSPKSKDDAHVKWHKSPETLDLILSKHTERKVTKNLEFSLSREIFQILGEGKGRRIQQGSIKLYRFPSGEIKAFYEGRELQIRSLGKKPGPLTIDSKEINYEVDKLAKNDPRGLHTGSTPTPSLAA